MTRTRGFGLWLAHGVHASELPRFVLFFTLIAALPAQQKKRVAVMNFDYATVQSGVAALFGTNQDVGKGIADILVDKLVNDGAYSVIERKQLDKIIAEQNFSNSDRADPNSAAKIARILGVDAIIVGSITQFGRDDKSTNVGGGAASSALGRFGIGGVKTTKSTAVCQITARMIDTSTAEILASVQGHGEETRNGTGILGAGGSYAGMAGGRARHEEFQLRQHHPRRGGQQGDHGRGARSGSEGGVAAHRARQGRQDRWRGGGRFPRRHPHHQCRLQGRRQGGRHPGHQSQGARGAATPPAAKSSAAWWMPSAPSRSPKWTKPPRSASSPAPAPPKSATPCPTRNRRIMNLEIGSTVGDYQVVGILGAGGMGQVYKVRNVISDRVEAMKVLLPDLVNQPDLADRFLREIKVQASLEHPNIAALHTAVRVENQLLMLMEFVEGVTLDQKLKDGPLPAAEAVNYIMQVLAALDYAHARGVVHRDIKPANMMLTPGGVVKLMDFGIARSSADHKLTQTGTTVGSLVLHVAGADSGRHRARCAFATCTRSACRSTNW